MNINKTLLLIFITLFFSTANAKIIEVEQLFNRTTVKVKEQNIGETKSFYGKTKIDESKLTDVVTRFDGFVTSLEANKNFMFIKKNEPLFSIYSDELLAIQKEIQIAKNVNRNIYRSTVEKLDRFDISKSEIKKLKANKIKAKGVTIYSPSNAIVLKKNINDKSFVKKGKLLLQLANIDKIWFVAQVYQKDLNFIKKDMSARVYIDGFSKSIPTKVDFIYPYLDEKTKTIDVRFVLDNKDLKIYPNMFASVKIKSSSKTMLTLPKTAVLTKGRNYYVFKPVSKTEFEPVKVEVKRIASSKYEILDGLEAGDEVINNALFLLDSDAVTNALYETDEDDDW